MFLSRGIGFLQLERQQKLRCFGRIVFSLPLCLKCCLLLYWPYVCQSLSGSFLVSWDTLIKFSSVTQSSYFALSFVWAYFQTPGVELSVFLGLVLYKQGFFRHIPSNSPLTVNAIFSFFLFRTVKLFTVLYARVLVLFSSLMCYNDVGKTNVAYPGALGYLIGKLIINANLRATFYAALNMYSRPALPRAGATSQPHVAVQHVKCGKSKLRCALSIKYTRDFNDLVWEKECEVAH